MEVSNHTEELDGEPDGQELIQTVVSLTGLPEAWVLPELDQILENSGQDSRDLTLQQLRDAMLAYLEAMQSDFLSEIEPEVEPEVETEEESAQLPD